MKEWILRLSPFLLAGCTISLPEVGTLSTRPFLSPGEKMELASAQPRSSTLPRDGSFFIPPPKPNVRIPEVGEKLWMIFRITPEISQAMDAFFEKDYSRVLAALDAAEEDVESDEILYFINVMRGQALIVTAHNEEQQEVVRGNMEREIALFGNNADGLSRLGEERLWSGDLTAANAYYGRILGAIADWRMPTNYLLPPVNALEAAHIWNGQVRSFTGMACIRILQGDYSAAVNWALAGEERYLEAMGMMHHPLYGKFIKPNPWTYRAHGWHLTMLGGAIAGEQRSLEAADPVFEKARDYFKAGRFPDADLAVETIRNLVGVRTGLLPSETEKIGILEKPADAEVDFNSLLVTRSGRPAARESLELPIPAPETVSLPAIGELTIYGFPVTAALSEAFSHYLAGEAQEALTALDAADQEEGSQNPLRRWYLAYLRAQTLILMGRAADAEDSILEIERLEAPVFGTNLNARALRGEARFWIGDLDGAVADFAQVIRALDGWRLPTLYVAPPPDTSVVVALTRAHFRSLMGMAGALMLRRDYGNAARFAEEAEAVFTDVFYMIHHPLYGAHVAIDQDLYYVRGVNLGILGAARMVTSGDVPIGSPYFEAANAYFDALGYAAGRATVDSFRIRALMDLERPDLAAALAKEAARRATDQGLADAVWRIRAMHGEALLAIGEPDEAEMVFRAADEAIMLVTGSLSSDRSKRRFGVGKEDITRSLVEMDVKKGDLDSLFNDLERGRARAFVDLMGERPLSLERESEAVSEVRRLDSEIRASRLRNAAPGLVTPESLEAERQLLGRRAEVIAALSLRDPEVAELLSVSARNLADVRTRLSPGDRLAYFLPLKEGEGIRVLLAGRTETRLVESDLTPRELSDAIESFRTEDPYGTVPQQKAAAAVIASGLRIPEWNVGSSLFIVPSGAAYFIPWGALDLAAPVVVLPTGSWLVRNAHAVERSVPAAVIGDPDMNKDWLPLPAARQEALAVAKVYGVSPLLGAEATESQLRRQLGAGGNVLHIATHGFFDGSEPMNSGIVLSPEEGSDGILTAADLFANPLPARLVVLSACETGAGKTTPGEDFLGLTRSLYLGGALAVVNSLYPVVDSPTRQFMEIFHQEARDGDYGRAWRMARDALRTAGEPPAIYGAFILGGSSRAVAGE